MVVIDYQLNNLVNRQVFSLEAVEAEMDDEEDQPVIAQGLRSPISPQSVYETALSSDGHFSRSTVAPRSGESFTIPNAFFQEQWEEWMQWDGVAGTLSPQTTPRPSLENSESDQSSSAPRSQTNPIQDPAKLIVQTKSQQISKKRKKSSEGIESTELEGGKSNRQSGSQRSHTIIEKRYRTNLNDKIAELRESVPSLRVDEPISADLGASTPAAKLHKATILSKATEYIHQLEKRNKSLENENAQLRCRNRSSQREKKDVNEPQNITLYTNNERTSSQSPIADSRVTSHLVHPGSAPEGMIRVPENMKRLRPSAPQEHYADQLKSASKQYGDLDHEPHATGQQGTSHGKFVGKLMLGSLVGLFVVEGFTENESDGRDPQGRGLWALTSPFYSPVGHLRSASQYLFPSSQFLSMSSLLKATLVLSVLALALFLYLFSAKPAPSKKPTTIPLAAAPSLASPIEVRQKAWLTSIQTIGVPRHKMLPELMALHLEASKYVLRQLIGWSGYAWLTGKTEDDEIARIKAWDIAIDAQLTGGDSEVSKSRLVLTIWASGTLPSTPTRLMLKALHIRILLWEASKSGWSVWCLLHKAASRLARHQWILAQKIRETQLLKQSKSPPTSECLPNHLLQLLKLDSDELFTDRIVQRAYNLTWDRPTREDTDDEDLGVDTVVEDCAIRSPLDALAAWASSFTLQHTIHEWFRGDCLLSESHKSQIQLALNIAPPASCAYVRALAAKAVFFDANRGSNITKLLHEIDPPKLAYMSDEKKAHHKSIFIDSSIPALIRNDVNAIRKCAIAIDSLTCQSRTPREIYKAVDTLAMIYVNADNLSFLGLAASHQLLRVLVEQTINREVAARLNYIRSLLKIWINDPVKRKIPLDARERGMITAALDRVVINASSKRRLSEASNDTGYESMSDPDELV